MGEVGVSINFLGRCSNTLAGSRTSTNLIPNKSTSTLLVLLTPNKSTLSWRQSMVIISYVLNFVVILTLSRHYRSRESPNVRLNIVITPSSALFVTPVSLHIRTDSKLKIG